MLGSKMTIFSLKTATRIAIPVLALVALFLAAGCGSENETAEIKPDYPEGWETYTYQQIRIVHPPQHPHQEQFHSIAQGYANALARNCRFLSIPVPFDTLVVYYYTGPSQGWEMTGEKFPFVDSADVIHFWTPGWLGISLMEYLIPKWLPKKPQYRFLQHGLTTLFDYSPHNYNELTWRYYNDTLFVPLLDLATDTTDYRDDINRERPQTAEAASFVDFLVYNWGIQGLNFMWRAEARFDWASEGIFGIKVDSMETLWLTFVEKSVKGELPVSNPAVSDTTKPND